MRITTVIGLVLVSSAAMGTVWGQDAGHAMGLDQVKDRNGKKVECSSLTLHELLQSECKVMYLDSFLGIS